MDDQPSNSSAGGTLSVAVLTLCIAFFALTLFQTLMLTRAHQTLTTLKANQEQPIQDATKLRQRVEDLAGRTAKLAAEGNVSAQLVVDNFRRQGVDIKLPAK